MKVTTYRAGTPIQEHITKVGVNNDFGERVCPLLYLDKFLTDVDN